MGRHEAQHLGLTGRRLQLTAAAAALVVALLVVAAVVRADRDSGTDPAAHPATSRTALPLSAGTGSGSPTPSSSGSPTASPGMMAMGPTLELRAVGTSWVEVRGPADRVLVARIFRKGDRATFNPSRVHLTIGNAAAVRVTANGMPVKRGRPGRVMLMTVVRGGD
jgi:hypothetical protein